MKLCKIKCYQLDLATDILAIGIRMGCSKIMCCHRRPPRENVEIESDVARKQSGPLKS